MENSKKDKTIDPAALPEKETFQSKEVYQHKQPADAGKPIEDETANAVKSPIKDDQKTSKEEGLNQEKSDADADFLE